VIILESKKIKEGLLELKLKIEEMLHYIKSKEENSTKNLILELVKKKDRDGELLSEKELETFFGVEANFRENYLKLLKEGEIFSIKGYVFPTDSKRDLASLDLFNEKNG